MGLFDKFKRSLGYQDKSLRERGSEGTATVLSSKKTMMSDDDSTYVYKTTLLVTVAGGQPYEVAYKVEGGLTEGATYTVFVDPEDKEKVFVDPRSGVTAPPTEPLSELDKLRGWKRSP